MCPPIRWCGDSYSDRAACSHQSEPMSRRVNGPVKLITEPYLVQNARWPRSGRHIPAQFDAESVVVYQAYNLSIGHFAARHGYFGGDFSTSRMTWIKPNFLWMMYRSGWGTKENREVT